LKADDLIYAGIATHYIKSNHLEELKQCLIAASEVEDSSKLGDSGDCAASVLMSFHDDVDSDASFLSQNRYDIDYAFDGKDSVEEIFDSLESMGPESKFGTSTLSTLKTLSPTSLKVTLEGLKRGAKAGTIAEALQMEYRIVMHMMKEGSDFYEGIRAALVDKDGNPKWSPANLNDVTEEMVNSYFEELGDEHNFIGKESAKL
jgi:enoyl-CoA hydratase/carnithine racemase